VDLFRRGRPALHKDGFHKDVRKYDDRGNVTERAYFGVDGLPCLRKDGYHKDVKKYDEHGNVTERSIFGTDGKAVRLMVVVDAVTPNSVADALGLKQGDVLLSYRGQKCRSVAWFLAACKADSKKPDAAEIAVQRGQKQFTLQVKPGLLGIDLVDVAESVALPGG
jgi:S1-C subfamily serine protease